jgi:hypothetical protein
MKEHKEAIEIEVLLNGKTVILDKHVPIQILKKQHFAYLKLKDCKLPSVGALEVWVREEEAKPRK